MAPPKLLVAGPAAGLRHRGAADARRFLGVEDLPSSSGQSAETVPKQNCYSLHKALIGLIVGFWVAVGGWQSQASVGKPTFHEVINPECGALRVGSHRVKRTSFVAMAHMVTATENVPSFYPWKNSRPTQAALLSGSPRDCIFACDDVLNVHLRHQLL